MGDMDAIPDAIKKWKKRFKRAVCCGVLTVLFSIGFLVGGIALLVYFTKYWGEDDEWERHLAYTGAAFVLIGFLGILIAIIVFIVVYRVYRRFESRGNPQAHKMNVPKYAQGEAPYPQQAPAAAPAQQPLAPSAPSGPQYNATDQADVKIEVSEHHKF